MEHFGLNLQASKIGQTQSNMVPHYCTGPCGSINIEFDLFRNLKQFAKNCLYWPLRPPKRCNPFKIINLNIEFPQAPQK